MTDWHEVLGWTGWVATALVFCGLFISGIAYGCERNLAFNSKQGVTQMQNNAKQELYKLCSRKFLAGDIEGNCILALFPDAIVHTQAQ